MGGSRCGSTASTVVLIPSKSITGVLIKCVTESTDKTGGDKWKLLSANVGDSRTVLCREGQALQITVDHKVE